MCTEAAAHLSIPARSFASQAPNRTSDSAGRSTPLSTQTAPIRTLFNGLGHMGTRGLQALLLVADDLRPRGVEVSVRALLDVDRAITGTVQQTLANLSPTPEILVQERSAPVDLARLIENFAQHDDEAAKYLVYDASPNRFHFPNLKSVLPLPNTLYLTEKPMLSDSSELIELENLCRTSPDKHTAFASRVFCDLIETQSEVCLHLADMVASGDLEIDDLVFFRLSSSGISKARRIAERSGVQGGAFIDKAIHDISVTLALLGGASANRTSVAVTSATPLCFLPRTEGSRTGLLDGLNRIWSGVRSFTEWPADGASIVQTEWHCGVKVVPVTYSASWVGVQPFDDLRCRRAADTPALSDILVRGEGCPEWLYARSAAPGFINEDARLLQINGRLRGAPTTLLVNFLAASKSVAPWIWDCSARRILPIPRRKYGANSLARVFEHVLLRDTASSPLGIDFDSALHAHRILWKAHEQLIPACINADLERKLSESILNSPNAS